MRKILEVLECDNGEFKFDTDVDVDKDPESLIDITVKAIFTMATKLWGGNEQSVIAMIRALFIADMALSPNRQVMCKMLVEDQKSCTKYFKKVSHYVARSGRFRPALPRI